MNLIGILLKGLPTEDGVKILRKNETNFVLIANQVAIDRKKLCWLVEYWVSREISKATLLLTFLAWTEKSVIEQRVFCTSGKRFKVERVVRREKNYPLYGQIFKYFRI